VHAYVYLQVVMPSQGVIEAVVALTNRHAHHEGIQNSGVNLFCVLSYVAANKVLTGVKRVE
jgi:hypothetical protein